MLLLTQPLTIFYFQFAHSNGWSQVLEHLHLLNLFSIQSHSKMFPRFWQLTRSHIFLEYSLLAHLQRSYLPFLLSSGILRKQLVRFLRTPRFFKEASLPFSSRCFIHVTVKPQGRHYISLRQTHVYNEQLTLFSPQSYPTLCFPIAFNCSLPLGAVTTLSIQLSSVLNLFQVHYTNE